MTRSRLFSLLSVTASLFLLGVTTFGYERANAQPSQPSPSSQTQPKPQGKIRIAILDFDYSSISNPAYLSFLPGGAKGVSDILTTKLVQSGNYTVIERSQIEQILREQDLGASGRVDASTAAEIGRILGVQVVIIGSITQFDLQKKESGGGALGIGAETAETEAYVKVSTRVVNTSTSEILSVAEGNGKADQSDTSVSVFGIGGGSETSNEGKLLTDATDQAVTQVVEALDSNAATMSNLPSPVTSVSALVADITGNSIVLNKGSSDGYRQGMRVSIERITKEVKDPATGEVIRQLTQPIGMVEIVEVDGRSSIGKIVSGTQFQVGDVAKPTQE
jgi:curli biogenesis system outer membrane secretion channel CsgG